MASLLMQLQEVPPRNVILVVGPPGSGKSTFCHQAILNTLAANKYVIFVVTEHGPADVLRVLHEQGLGKLPEKNLNFIDAFHETVGLPSTGRPDTVDAHCGDLTGLEVAISKLQTALPQKNIMLVFDSLTSSYLLTGSKLIQFLKFSLGKFAAVGNTVFASMAEGCGNPEDLGAMLSLANGIIKMEVENGSFFVNVIKHPVVKPTKLQIAQTEKITLPSRVMDAVVTQHYMQSHPPKRVLSKIRDQWYDPDFRVETGNFINVWWGNFTFWSGLFWDSKRFPALLYDVTKELTHQISTQIISKHPWWGRLMWDFLPKRFFRFNEIFGREFMKAYKEGGMGITEHLTERSGPEEHHIRIHECASAWGFEGVGERLCYSHPPFLAGFFEFFDEKKGSGREWSAVETKCVGEGAPYCEFKIMPYAFDELEDYLTALDSSLVDKIADRLMEHVRNFIIDQKPLGKRPTLGSELHIQNLSRFLTLPALASDRYRMAVRFGGVAAGKRLGEYLLENIGLREDEAIQCIVELLEYCKVGKISIGETIRIKENFECFGIEGDQPLHFFTSGFLNGVFSTVNNQHIRETRCIAVGAPYCEWEFR